MEHHHMSQSSESTDDSLEVCHSASGNSRKRRNRPDLNDEEYKRRRERNNEAVRRCRIKSREKSKEMAEKVSFLREENAILSQKVQILSKELTLLKELFLTHAKGSSNKTLVVNVLAEKQKKQQADAIVPQTSDHAYVMTPGSPNEPSIKLEKLDSDDDIVDLSVRRPGIVVERAVENDG